MSSENSRKATKRPHPSILTCSADSQDSLESAYVCAICLDIFSNASITPCGHTFCHTCIKEAVETSKHCPRCNRMIGDPSSIIPNYLVNQLVETFKASLLQRVEPSVNVVEVRNYLQSHAPELRLSDVDFMLDFLIQKKKQLKAQSSWSETELLREFLLSLQKKKRMQFDQLTRELDVLQKDLSVVDNSLLELERRYSSFGDGSLVTPAAVDQVVEPQPTASVKSVDVKSALSSLSVNCFGAKTTSNGPSLPDRRLRMHAHFEDLEKAYFLTRNADITFAPQLSTGSSDGFTEFRQNFQSMTRFCGIRLLASLQYATDIFNNSNIVSSIEFDKDNDFFAIAGVTKRIKVYDFHAVVNDIIDVHYPAVEMVTTSKISCVAWNSFQKHILASSDYEGSVAVWDTNASSATAQRVGLYKEHEKRCWSVDFNPQDYNMLASGSDDARIKLWSINMEHSVATLEAKANVCCVKFNPESRYHLAFGSADHCVHYYDLRQPKRALHVFQGHKKAVSYVKFIDKDTIASASTDSHLKMWSVTDPSSSCLRSFTGHVNEKNFVGLATDGTYIACGSENNALYVYYKGFEQPLLNYKFDVMRSVLDKERKEEDTNEFISAVCWRQHSNVLITANSQGTIKVLEMV